MDGASTISKNAIVFQIPGQPGHSLAVDLYPNDPLNPIAFNNTLSQAHTYAQNQLQENGDVPLPAEFVNNDVVVASNGSVEVKFSTDDEATPVPIRWGVIEAAFALMLVQAGQGGWACLVRWEIDFSPELWFTRATGLIEPVSPVGISPAITTTAASVAAQ